MVLPGFSPRSWIVVRWSWSMVTGALDGQHSFQRVTVTREVRRGMPGGDMYGNPIYIYVYIYIYMMYDMYYICILHIHTYIHTYIYTYIYIYIYIYVCIYRYTDIHINIIVLYMCAIYGIYIYIYDIHDINTM